MLKLAGEPLGTTPARPLDRGGEPRPRRDRARGRLRREREDDRERAVRAVAEVLLEHLANLLGLRPRHREGVREDRRELRARKPAAGRVRRSTPRERSGDAGSRTSSTEPRPNLASGYGYGDGAARQAEPREHPGRDRGALLGALAGAALRRPSPRLPAERRQLPHRREPHELTVIVEVPGIDPRVAHDRRQRADAPDRRRAVARARRRPRLPADGDRVRPVLAPGAARPRTSIPTARPPRYEHGIVTISLPIADKPLPRARYTIAVEHA